MAVSQSIKIIICESHANFFYDLISYQNLRGRPGGGRFLIFIDTLQILVSSAFQFLFINKFKNFRNLRLQRKPNYQHSFRDVTWLHEK